MRRTIAAGTLLISAILLFAGLGHYALWDDEAVTALAADGVWRTGDTSVILDHNIVAYRSGLLLKGTKERSTPPLGAYFAAPFLGIFGHSALVARLPFAFVGLLSVGMMLWWLKTVDAKWVTFLLLGLAIIGNVSFQLYSRQCRYYSPAIFSSIVIAYLYLNWNGKRWQLALMAAAGLVLWSSNYLNYLALHFCLLGDYLIIGRKRKWLTWKDWLWVLVPQIAIGLPIGWVWYPLSTANEDYAFKNGPIQILQLIYLSLRDINVCEYGIGSFVLLAPFICLWQFLAKRPVEAWLVRGPTILLCYVIVICLVSPQRLERDQPLPDADVRYIAAAIPLCIAISVIVVLQTAKVSPWLAIGLGLVGFGSNLLNGAPLNGAPLRSTIVLRIGELINAPPDPYTAAAEWINRNVGLQQSVWIVPTYMTYPLMFHAPKPTYAWQFFDQLPPALARWPRIHINGQDRPDYIICFGGPDAKVQDLLSKLTNAPAATRPYDVVAYLDVYGRDKFRPELFWRSFEALRPQMDQGTGIYIFKLRTAPSISQVRPQ